jgi:hypothetical protein
MRFCLIDSRHRTLFDCQTPVPFEDLVARLLKCDAPHSVELTDDLDLWLAPDPVAGSFRFFPDGPEFAGNGVLCGRSKFGDFKSLPRRYGYEMIRNWLVFPERRPIEVQWRRPINLRPGGFPLTGLALGSCHGIAREGAREMPYVMQMYA